MNEQIKELLKAAKQSVRYLDHDDCSYGINNPEGDFCTCGVQKVINRLRKAIEAVDEHFTTSN